MFNNILETKKKTQKQPKKKQKKKVEGLARDILTDPVRINVGTIGAANIDVKQIPVILPSEEQKWIWLLSNIQNLLLEGNILIFVSQKIQTETIANNLTSAGFPSASLHGDKSQQERQKIMFAFTHSNINILVATDIIARGDLFIILFYFILF